MRYKITLKFDSGIVRHYWAEDSIDANFLPEILRKGLLCDVIVREEFAKVYRDGILKEINKKDRFGS